MLMGAANRHDHRRVSPQPSPPPPPIISGAPAPKKGENVRPSYLDPPVHGLQHGIDRFDGDPVLVPRQPREHIGGEVDARVAGPAQAQRRADNFGLDVGLWILVG